MDMAQNINMQYVLAQSAGVLAPGQRDQFRPSPLQPLIRMHGPNPGSRAISAHKLNLGFTQDPAQKALYPEWRNCAKDQMIARGFGRPGRKAPNFAKANILPIYIGIRNLGPTCDYIVWAVAANYMQRLANVAKAVVQPVKDSCLKLNNTNNKGNMRVPNPLIPLAHVVVMESLLPPRVLNEWGTATTIHNPGQLPQNVPPVNLPAGQPLDQTQLGGNALQGQIVPVVQHLVPEIPAGNPGQGLHSSCVTSCSGTPCW